VKKLCCSGRNLLLVVLVSFTYQQVLFSQAFGTFTLQEEDTEKKFNQLKIQMSIFTQAEEYQNLGDSFLSEGNYKKAAQNYIMSLETVFNNYDLHCFLKKVGFNYNQVADIKGNSQFKDFLIEELSKKLEN
jgi:hypothetical protein